MEGQFAQVVRERILSELDRLRAQLTPRQVKRPRGLGKALAVIGMRRSGKTTYLHQLRGEMLAAGRSAHHLVYFNFEDERLADLSARELHVITDTWRRLFPDPSAEPLTLFLDEMQRIDGWELYARRLLDTAGHELFLSGSSAKLLSREVATSMRGRALELTIRPFSFEEFLLHHQKKIPVTPARVTLEAAALVQRDFRRYLKDGGFPEAQGLDSQERRQLLSGYIDIVLLRDIIERHQVSQATALRWLVRRLLANPGGAMSVSKLVADLKAQGLAIAKDTVHEFFAFLEDSFLVTGVSVATDSERRRQTNPRKVYPVDTGLLPLFDRSAKQNIGHLLEVAVFHELQRRGADISYVKNVTGSEVDFLARFGDGSEDLIQVCASLDDPETRQREIRALIDARPTWPRARQLILTLEHQAPFPAVPTDIRVMAAWQWCLARREGK